MLIEINKIYNESCLDTMSRMPDKFIDLTLTDPPYGIGLKYDTYEDTDENWFKLMEQVIPEIKRVSKMAIFPSCKIDRLKWFYENFPPNWLICWYKGSTGHNSYIGFNDWEPHLVYGKNKNKMYMHDYFQTISSPKMGSYGHPCPKPDEWAEWIIQRASKKGDLVYDPFMGSGTVGYVAYLNERNYIGSEISTKYCKKIEKRIPKVAGRIERFW
jgi:site-specific DNA-methyltransferase (adenine-specific)